jgi:hypothetical protein
LPELRREAPDAEGEIIMKKQEKKLLLEYRKGKVALSQLREVQSLLNEAGVPEFVTVSGNHGNAPQVRLKWYLMRRKDVSIAEVDHDVLTREERDVIALLVPFGRTNLICEH